jgi:anti-sigma B factor antagonist
VAANLPGHYHRSMQPGPTLEIAIDTSNGVTILSPKGDVDMARSPVMLKAITDSLQKKPTALVLDLSNVPYMDSSGLATMVGALQNARKGQTPLKLCGLTARVRSILEIARLNTVFTIFDTREQALQG